MTDLMTGLEASLTTFEGDHLDGDERVRWLTRQSKATLRQIMERWAARRGRRWVVGGPGAMSHDELVSACARIYRGEEP